MRRLAAAAVLLSLAACVRDASLPPPPGPGTIQGRVVYAVPGQVARVAASGARLTILTTSIGAIAATDGRFVVENGGVTGGSLLVQVDLNGDGVPDRQKLIDLAAAGAKPGRDLDLGDVVVVENARIRGRVLRADVPTPTTGHAGTVVFVPEGPFTTLTGDDGSYLFENLPEGRISLTFFRDGYDPAAIDGIVLGAAQDYVARDVTLARSPPPPGGIPQPGAITGQLSFTPGASGAGATVSAIPVLSGSTLSAPASATGAFRLGTVPPGLYRVEVAMAGYTTAIVSNVMVPAGTEVRLAVSLAAMGVSAPPPPVVTVPSCVAGARCDLPNACLVGQVSCATGTPTCAPIGNAIDGISCGTGRVCSAGSCVTVCVAGAACQPPANPCLEGVVSCGTGSPVCVAGTAARADGTACGLDRVCKGGVCGACVANAACTPLNPCDAGLTDCSTGAALCRDTGLALSDGTSCGASLFCAFGVCGACQPGKSCTPAGFPCHSGTTSCATGRALCVDTAIGLADGSSCGTDMVCRSGACGACVANAACTPANACHAGKIACGTGLPVCVDQQTNLAAGAGCGTNQVCNGAGGCVACTVNAACTPANACHVGAIGCSTGAPVCGDTPVAVANGAPCGTNQVCNAGACVACTAGAACTPSNACHFGSTSCATGSSVCTDTAASLSDGATCGANAVCKTGVCSPCAIGAACDGAVGHAAPALSPLPCKQYGTACSSGTPACVAFADKADGTACPDLSGGSTYVCRSGACAQAGYSIVVALGGLAGQSLPGGTTLAAGHAYPNGTFTVKVQVVDVLGAAVLASQTIAATAPEGAIVTPASAATSTVDGTATFTVRLGRALGTQTFRFTTGTAWAPLDVAMTADAVPDGFMWPLVNVANGAITSCTLNGIPGPGSTATMAISSYGVGLVPDAAGNLYVAEPNSARILKLAPSGLVTVLAGSSCTAGYLGDGGSALSARFNVPMGLALDQRDAANPLLYVADDANNRVRAINLATGIIDLVAGDGTAGTGAPYGDGADARAAQLSDPAFVAVAPTGYLYVADRGHGRIRKIAPAGPTRSITTVATASATCTGPLVLNALTAGQDANGALAVDERGRLFAAAQFCGGAVGAAKKVVARLEDDGSWTLVAGGGAAFVQTTGVPAKSIAFTTVSGNPLVSPMIAFDRPSDGGPSSLFLSFFSWVNSYVARVDAITGRWDVVTTPKSAATTSSGEFGTTAAAHLPSPGAANASIGRDLVISEGWGSYAGLRVLSGVAPVTAPRGNLALVSGSLQTIWIDEAPFQCPTPGTCLQPNDLPLLVRLTDALGAPLAGVEVKFAMAATALSGGSISGSSVVTTDSNGYAAGGVRAGLKAGRYDVTARVVDLHGQDVTGSPVTFTITAVEPPKGTVFTLVNDGHVSGRTGIGGPGSLAQVAATRGSVLLGDGSLVFTSDHSVYRVDPYGILTVLAGTGTAGYSGDGGPAASALLNGPAGLSLDPVGNQLYVADYGNHRVRAINLATGFIRTVIGNGTVGSSGDSGPATSALVAYPMNVTVAGGWLLVEDTNNSAIRRIGIDPLNAATLGNVFSYLWQGAATVGQTTAAIACASNPSTPVYWGTGCFVGGCNPGGRAAVDPTGTVYVPGYYCGTPFSTNPAIGAIFGVVRVDPVSGALEKIAGRYLGTSPGEGVALGAMAFPALGPPNLQFDPSGRLWISVRDTAVGGNVVGWVDPDPVTRKVEATGVLHVVGQATTASVPPANSYTASAPAYFASPSYLSVDASGHVYVTDSGYVATYPSNSIRVIW